MSQNTLFEKSTKKSVCLIQANAKTTVAVCLGTPPLTLQPVVRNRLRLHPKNLDTRTCRTQLGMNTVFGSGLKSAQQAAKTSVTNTLPPIPIRVNSWTTKKRGRHFGQPQFSILNSQSNPLTHQLSPFFFISASFFLASSIASSQDFLIG